MGTEGILVGFGREGGRGQAIKRYERITMVSTFVGTEGIDGWLGTEGEDWW